MKIYQYFMGVKPYMQLLALLIMSVVFLIIGSFVSMMFMPLFTSGDDMLGSVTTVMENVSFMRFLQGSTQIFYMLIPSLLFGFMFYPSIVDFFKMRRSFEHDIFHFDEYFALCRRKYEFLDDDINLIKYKNN